MLSSASWFPAVVGFLAVSLAAAIWFGLTRLIFKSQKSRDITGNIGLVVFSVAYSLVVAELLVSVFLVQSQGMGGTLAARRWGNRYWHPTFNSLGYRDVEPVWSDHALFMVGDSFAAGAGIERLEDRMSGVLGRKLGRRWTVATLADAGWDSTREFEALLDYPKRPDVIVVSYFLNDFEAAATKHGLPTPQIVVQPPALLKPLVDRSSLANWLYWRFSNQGAYDKYWSYAKSAYASPEIFADHLADLMKFKTYTDTIGAQLYFVIWPALVDVSGSEVITSKVATALKAQGVRVIDLAPYLRGRPADELVVNSSDPHTTARVHAEVAELIFARLSKDGATFSQAPASAPVP